MTQHRLGDYDAGNADWTTPNVDESDRQPSTKDQCIAIAATTGERCSNPISRMDDSQFCSAHARASDPETIETT